ncbi:MAG TPA: hypothetical protein VID49_05075 [Steroidobacteraceae bacterium]|jgi:hypothetical protein
MKTTLSGLTALTLAAAALFLASFGLRAQTPASPMTIGVVLPHGQLDGGASVSGALRQSVVEQLRRPGVETVALDGTSPEQVDAEARTKHCTHVLYTNVEQKHAGGGLLHKLAPMASMLSLGAMAGAGGRMGGGAMSALAQGAAQNAISSSVASSQQQALGQLTGAQQSGVKRGDTISLEYRLTAVGSTAPLRSATLQGKADNDGQDVLSPLVGQLAGSVAGSAGVPAGAPAATTTSTAPSAPPSSSGTSMLGGLFGRHRAPPSQAPAATPDCAQIAAMPDAHVSLEACQKMMASQQAYNGALADPSVSRPGDEQMSCDQIMAEMKQQQISAPDKAQAAEAQSAVKDEQAMLAKHQKEAAVQQAKDQARDNAASAADRATEMATMGVVSGHALAAAEKVNDAEDKAMNRRMLDEAKPTDTRMLNSTAALATGAASQLSANPRLARLVQLANTHRCRGG